MWASKKELGTVDKPRLVQKFDPKLSVQCYQPLPPAHTDGGLDDLCHAMLAYARTHSGMYMLVDDIMPCCNSSHTLQGLLDVWTMGRALEVGAWAGAQRPIGIPEVFRSQANHLFIFQVDGPDDRKYAAQLAHTPSVEYNTLSGHNYWYYTDTMHSAVLMPSLKLKDKPHVRLVRGS